MERRRVPLPSLSSSLEKELSTPQDDTEKLLAQEFDDAEYDDATAASLGGLSKASKLSKNAPGFLLLQVNLMVGKLLIDRENGKLAKSGFLDRTARAFGMNGLYALVLSVVLVARRSFLHKMFGLSGERAARYHVLTGQFGAVMLILHGVLYVLVWYMQGKVINMLLPCLEETCTPKQQYGSSRNFFGLVALVPLLVVVLSSLEWVRRRYFRRFIVLHCLSVVFVAFTALHYYPTTFWLIPAFVLYAIYRMVSVFGRGQASVVSATALSDKVFQLELRRLASGGSDFVSGQYVYIKVDAIGKNEWHPFTISSSPLRNRHSFVLDAKVQGSFTSQLLSLMKTQQLHTVHVDGYYGSKIKLAPHMVFVAGGSGMTPFLSLLDHLRALADAGAGAVGSVLGASLVLFLVQRLRARKSDDSREGALGVALGEMEVAGLGVSSPAPPATPRAFPTPAQSLLSRSFLIEKERPDLGARLRNVHSEIRENYGMKANVALLVSGPAELQADALLQARELQAPMFQMHQKSFLL
ncbi:hypothetical protein JM16_009316 [Phytophthora kernoviae]|uniref:FAD-binding FR-type domain-containing protein n=1 Tax=Phytophthora kernoviae TaxID=325452 RepID=A0A8T0LJ66_9STRA|nr:hypothetical protein JM16_009316 [Phytophthora kernoviae]